MFKQTGACKYGDKCKFSHEAEVKISKADQKGDFSKVLRENETFDISMEMKKTNGTQNIMENKTLLKPQITQNTNSKAEKFKNAADSVRKLRTNYRQVNKKKMLKKTMRPLLLWALILFSVSAGAHRFAPSLLQIKTSGSDTYAVTWKTPIQQVSDVAMTPILTSWSSRVSGF